MLQPPGEWFCIGSDEGFVAVLASPGFYSCYAPRHTIGARILIEKPSAASRIHRSAWPNTATRSGQNGSETVTAAYTEPFAKWLQHRYASVLNCHRLTLAAYSRKRTLIGLVSCLSVRRSHVLYWNVLTRGQHEHG